MRTYLKTIQLTQKISLGLSIAIMLILPLIISFAPDWLSEATTLRLYSISHFTVFFVMIVRPLADILTGTSYIRPLVILRKGVGVLSASIVASFILAKIIINPAAYFGSLFTLSYWSLKNLAILAHLGDLSAILLLITSNNLSKRLLGPWWKRVQKLSYVYFYASSLYVLMIFHDGLVFWSMLIVSIVTIAAHFKNERKIISKPKLA
jgi:DMSO/TMAO reductase YedYZ heme-binding membrane subunit